MWTSTPPVAQCWPCWARTEPASPRSSRSLPATTRPMPARSSIEGARYACARPHARPAPSALPSSSRSSRTRRRSRSPRTSRWDASPTRRGVVSTGGRSVTAPRPSSIELEVDIDPDRPVGHAARWRAPDRRDRPFALRVGATAHPRRAHRCALPSRGRDPVRVHPTTAEPGRGDHLHHPPARRGHRDRRPGAGPARRRNVPARQT